MYCILPRSTVSCSQPVSHLSADHVVFNSLHLHIYDLTNEKTLSSHRTSLLNYLLPIDRLLVLLQSRLIMASKCICTLARSQPSSVSLNSHDYGLPFAISPPPIASPYSVDHGCQVHLQSLSITASRCISKLARFKPRGASLSPPNQGVVKRCSEEAGNPSSTLRHTSHSI